jgi:uncharacterized membrane protein
MNVNYTVISKVGIIILLLDFLYMQIIYKKFNNLIVSVQKSDIKLNTTGAILCYSLIIFMLYYFIIKENKPVLDAFILGFCTYGIYETTNLSLLNNWDYNIALIDTIWGGILYALTTYIIKNNYF